MTDMPHDEPHLTLLDRFRGLLLGGGVGDALGAPVEFMTRAEILARFGPRGVTTFAPAYGRLGAITDDTQMTLFTLDGLIRANVRAMSRGICNPASVIDHAYRRWLETQGGPFRRVDDLDGWLIGVEALWSRRAPGLTCEGALRAKGGSAFGTPARNDSKGCGGIMRVGPVGLYADDAYELGRETAALTHGHVSASVSAGWFALWVQEVAHGRSLSDGATAAWDRCRGASPDLDAMLALAFEAAAAGAGDVVPAALGGGWIGEEAAAIALWCVLTAPDPMEAIRRAANIDGDSESTGALVGQIFGAALGPGWIPGEMLDALELRAEMETLAADAVESLDLTAPQTVFAVSDEPATPSPERRAAEARFGDFAVRYPGW